MTKIWNLIEIIAKIYHNFFSPPLLAQHWSSVCPIPFQIRLRRYFDCRTTCRGQPLHVTLAILNRDVIKSMTSSSRHFKLLHSLRLLSHLFSFFISFKINSKKMVTLFERFQRLLSFAPSVCCVKWSRNLSSAQFDIEILVVSTILSGIPFSSRIPVEQVTEAFSKPCTTS